MAQRRILRLGRDGALRRPRTRGRSANGQRRTAQRAVPTRIGFAVRADFSIVARVDFLTRAMAQWKVGRARLLLLLTMAWVLTPAGYSAPATGVAAPAAEDFLIESWDVDNGLPQNSATAIAQTPDGYLWFGTFDGVVRFDGARFTVYEATTTK